MGRQFSHHVGLEAEAAVRRDGREYLHAVESPHQTVEGNREMRDDSVLRVRVVEHRSEDRRYNSVMRCSYSRRLEIGYRTCKDSRLELATHLRFGIMNTYDTAIKIS